MLQRHEHRGPVVLGQNCLESAVVENIAVLVDLDEGSALVRVGSPENLGHVLAVHIVGTGYERRLGTKGQRNGVVRVVKRPERRGFCYLSGLRRRGVLPLCETVNLIVEQDDREIDVPAEGVQQMVAPYRKSIPVTGYNPDVEIRTRNCQPGGERRGAPVDRMNAICVHVVGEAARAADPRHKHGVLTFGTQIGHHQLHSGQDRVVTTTGAPTYFLVARPVLPGCDRNFHVCHSASSAALEAPLPLRLPRESKCETIAACTSIRRNGKPSTL